MNNERIWTLIAKKLAGDATATDLMELYELLKENPEVHYSLEIFDELWKQNDFAKRRPIAAYARLLKKMEQQGISFPPGERKDLKPPAPVVTKNKKSILSRLFTSGLMAKANIKATWRNLVRNKGYTIINITGLAIGMAASILLLLWIFDELRFDKFHKNKDRIYHVVTRAEINGKAGEKHIGGFGIITDPAFLKILDYPLLQGNRNTALNDPRSLVLTEEFAKKIFGSTDVMGRLARIDSNANFMISVKAALVNPVRALRNE